MTSRGAPDTIVGVTAIVAAPGVAVVMPVRGQARDLPGAVAHILGTLAGSEHPHTVVIVDDASPDRTADVAEELARQYPGRVEVLRHRTRQGYRAALRTGMEAAIARTGHETILLTDAGGRFRAEDLLPLLGDASTERADVVVGERPARKGRVWSRRDLACAYTLVHRDVLEGTDPADPTTDGSALATRAREAGARVVRRELSATPDREATTAPRRVARSPREVLRGRRRRQGGERTRDPILTAVTLGSAVGSVLAFWHYLRAGLVLAYPDAVAHLLIARRVLESPTPGSAQLGGVWLPLPHMLSLPVVGIDPLYTSGAAGALVSMAAYVLTARYLYKLVHELTGRRWAGLVSATVFAVCPSVLYMQSTPMTELPLLCGIAGTTYYLARWTRTERHMDFTVTAAFALLATLTRYEGWVLAATVAGVVAVTVWRSSAGAPLRTRIRRVEAHVLAFGLIAFSGIIAWVGWNAIIFDDPTFFYDSRYAVVGLLDVDIADGDAVATLLTYWWAVVDNVGIALVVLAAEALVFYAIRTRLRGPYLAASIPMVFLPFFLWFLYSGSRPLRVVELTGYRYNVRFGLLMIIPVAILLGWLVAELARRLRDRRGWATSSVALVLVVVTAFSAAQGGVGTLQEALEFRARPEDQADMRAAAWLRGAYTSGRVLMDTPGNETLLGASAIPTREIVYDGSYRQWEPALADPASQGIDWIYMRGSFGAGGSVGGLADEPDRVWDALETSPALARYRLVYDADDRRVYHRIGAQ